MSRIYFRSIHGEAEVRGREEVQLENLARAQAERFWGLGEAAVAGQLDRAIQILGMMPGAHDHYLFKMMTEAVAERDADDRSWALAKERGQRWPSVWVEHEKRHRFPDAVATAMRTGGLRIQVGDVVCGTLDVDLNTALVSGSRPVALAAKLAGWGRAHCWVEGHNRRWLANIIQEGLDSGMYRRGLWYQKHLDSTDQEWSDSGWESVIDLLRSRDDCPVVTSHSSHDEFPNVLVTPAWPYDAQERPPWEDLSKAELAKMRRSERWFDGMPLDKQWDVALNGLREKSPWRQLAPKTLTRVKFHGELTVFDVFREKPPVPRQEDVGALP